MAELPVWRKGVVVASALVDDDVADELGMFHWFFNSDGYVVRRIHGGHERLHRRILGLCAGDRREGDHVNRDKLDNRRINLRVISKSEQSQNRNSHFGATSSHRGVSWHEGRRKWRARVCLNYQDHHLGWFDSETEAARAAKVFRAKNMRLATN